MISRFLPVKTGDSILNYFALPLVGMSKKDFGADFITTKVDKDATRVFVMVKDLSNFQEDDFPSQIQLEGNDYLFYMVPFVYREDMRKILSGRYSKLSPLAKKTIKSNSGLTMKNRRRNNIYTSKLLLALDKAPVLVDYMYDQLRVNKTVEDKALYETLNSSELAEKVSEDDFING